MSKNSALKITNQPDNVYCAIGGEASLTVAATGTCLFCRWQYSPDGGKTWHNSANSTATQGTLSISEVNEYLMGMAWRCKVMSGTNSVYSRAVYLKRNTTRWTNTYNADGIRVSRTNRESTYNYTYLSGQLTHLTVDGHTMYFYYGDNGTPMALSFNGVRYYYVTSLQGDVIAIVDQNGTVVTTYRYDAWGNHLHVTGSLSATVGRYNPLRYRGYVYDRETELYYLQSRYYDPEVGRFLNADGYVSTGQGINGFNMFAYCGNNPILNIDPFGTRYEEYAGGGGGVGSIGGLIGLGGFGGGGGGGNVGVIVSPSYYGYAGVYVQTPVGTIPFAGSAETISTPNPQQIYSSNEDTKEVYDFSKALKYFPNLSRKRTSHVHHIVPAGEFTNRNALTKQQISQMHKRLIDVGIDRVTDPMNLMLVSAGTHSTLHTNAYIAHVHEYIMSAASTKQGVYGALFNLRIEIAGMDRFAMGY